MPTIKNFLLLIHTQRCVYRWRPSAPKVNDEGTGYSEYYRDQYGRDPRNTTADEYPLGRVYGSDVAAIRSDYENGGYQDNTETPGNNPGLK